MLIDNYLCYPINKVYATIFTSINVFDDQILGIDLSY